MPDRLKKGCTVCNKRDMRYQWVIDIATRMGFDSDGIRVGA